MERSHESGADRRVAIALFLLAFVIYAWFFGGGGWNQNSHFALTRALVERHEIAIDAFRDSTGDIAARGDHVYSNKPPGLSIIAAVPYAILYTVERAAGAEPTGSILLTINAWLCTAIVCGALGALIPALIYLYGVRVTTRRWALATALAIAFATPLFCYATLLFLHVPNAALALFAFVAAFDRNRRRPFAAGLFAGLAFVVNYLAAVIVGVLAIVIVVRACDPERTNQRARLRALFLYALGALPSVVVLAAYQLAAFGQLFRIPISMNATFTSSHALFGIFGMPKWEAIVGITVSPYRGLFYFSPVLIFAFAGFVIMFRSRRLLELFTIVAISLAFFLFNVTFNNWEAGFGVSARYLLTIVPLLGIAMLYAGGLLRGTWIVLALLSFMNAFAATAVDPQPSGSIPYPLQQYIYPLLVHGEFSPKVALPYPWSAEAYRGHVGVNRQTIDEIVPFMKYPPGSRESEWASFNLGEAIGGTGSPLSLIPIGILVAGGVMGLFVLAGRAHADAETEAASLSP